MFVQESRTERESGRAPLHLRSYMQSASFIGAHERSVALAAARQWHEAGALADLAAHNE